MRDLSRQLRWLKARSDDAAEKADVAIDRSLLTLSEHPLPGTPVGSGVRQMVVRFGESSFVNQDRPLSDRVLVLRVHHGRQDR